MDWIAKINAELDRLGLYPDVEAYPITDLADHLVLVDTQEVTVYKSPEGVCRWLRLEPDKAPEEDDHDLFDRIGHAIAANRIPDGEINVIEEESHWRQDLYRPAEE